MKCPAYRDLTLIAHEPGLQVKVAKIIKTENLKDEQIKNMLECRNYDTNFLGVIICDKSLDE